VRRKRHSRRSSISSGELLERPAHELAISVMAVWAVILLAARTGASIVIGETAPSGLTLRLTVLPGRTSVSPATQAYLEC
jgi:hypothetical protein